MDNTRLDFIEVFATETEEECRKKLQQVVDDYIRIKLEQEE